MATSHITHGKQKDRVSSYAGGVGGGGGGILNRPSSGGPAIQDNHKKKPYRARGCRGGASRKGRKKQATNDDHSRQNEENDPSRLNTNPEKRSHNANATRDGSQHLKYNTTSSGKRESAKHGCAGSDKTRSIDVGPKQNKTRTLSILPNNSSHQSESVLSESNESAELSAQAQNGANNSEHKPILPGACSETVHLTSKSNVHRAIARPASSSAGAKDAHNAGAFSFSFFCISPRSFLSGQRKET